MLGFYNIVSDNKSVKRAQYMAQDNIETRRVIFVPMLARKITLEETESYSNLTAAQFEEFKAKPE